MAAIEEQPSSPRNPNNPSETPRKRRPSLTELWFKDQQLKHTIFKLQQKQHQTTSHHPNLKPLTLGDDCFSLISDENLELILSKVPKSQHVSISVVCKRWYYVLGKLMSSICLFDWLFLISGRLIGRFCNLIEVNLVPACFRSCSSSGIVISSKVTGSINVDVEVVSEGLIGEGWVLGCEVIDIGLRLLANGCPNLCKLSLVKASEEGLGFVAEHCETLQALEVHCCEDMVLRSLSKFRNLQILKLVSVVEGLYGSVVSDIGLTILAQGCRRLVKLELNGCEGSYDGIKAVGQCCQMLEELTFCGHRMDGGWLSALCYCGNLKTLKLQSCESIDSCPGPDEHLGSCSTLEELYVERCQVRDKRSARALFVVCASVREISFQDCWGLNDDIFRCAAVCRRVKSISLEGCSLLTIVGLDSVVHSWKELETLKVVSCNNIKDSDITPELATLFCSLKELKWRPDSRSLLASNLAGTGVGKKGGRFFKRVVTMVDKRKCLASRLQHAAH